MPKDNVVDPLNEFIFNFSTETPGKFVEEFVDFCSSNKNSYIISKCFLNEFLRDNLTPGAIYNIKNILFEKIEAELNIVKKANLFSCVNEIRVGNPHALYCAMLIQWLKNINIIGEFLDFYCIKKIAIYGYGEVGKMLVDMITSANKYSIECIIDQNSRAKNVVGIESLNEYAADIVIVTPIYDYQEIKSKLLSFHGNNNIRIESLWDIVFWEGSNK
jgi:hypothetical protein